MSMICGFPEADGSFCLTEAEARCETHTDLWCVSCGNHATRLCPAEEAEENRRCAVPLCERCTHQPGGDHDVTLTTAEIARQDLVGAMTLGLREVSSRGLCHVPEEHYEPVAAMLLEHLSNHTLMKVLSGMNGGVDEAARGRREQPADARPARDQALGDDGPWGANWPPARVREQPGETPA